MSERLSPQPNVVTSVTGFGFVATLVVSSTLLQLPVMLLT